MAHKFLGGKDYNLILHEKGFKYAPTAIIREDCKIGEDTMIWQFVNMYGCEVGKNCMIGTYTELQSDVKIGNNCRVQSHSFLCSLVTLEDNIFVGHGVMTINDVEPPSPNSDTWKSTYIGSNAMIGSNVTLFPVRIGKNAIIGAGSVVTRDVPANAVVAGNPARILEGKLSYKLSKEEKAKILGVSPSEL